MNKSINVQIITANDLFTGEVIYRSHKGWSDDLNLAKFYTDPILAQQDLQQSNCESDQIIGAYLTAMELINGRLQANHYREQIRTTGPSNYHHGKQNKTNAVDKFDAAA